MDPAEIARQLKAVGGVYGARAAEAERRRAAAAAAGTDHQLRAAEAARVEVMLWKSCQQVCEKGNLPMLINSGPTPRLAPEFAPVEKAAIAAGLVMFVQPDYKA